MPDILYCDLSIDGAAIWTGMPCQNLRSIGNYIDLPFIGELYFQDTQSDTDPQWAGLNGQYMLLYAQAGQPTLQVPLQAIAAQQFDVTLGGQNCTLSFYTLTVNWAPEGSGLLIQTPASTPLENL